jgi:ATP-binding protein involved in chromosome partitioning
MSGEVFGAGGGDQLARELGIPLLGSVPLDSLVRECGDAGEPVASAEPDSPSAHELLRIAEAVLEHREGAIVKPLTVVSR